MQVSNKSRHTIVNYRSDINYFLEHCPADIKNLNIETLRNHLDGLNSKSPTTVARHISSLKTFLNWCYKKDYILNNPIYKIEHIKPEKQTTNIEVADKNQIEKAICSISIFNNDNSINLNNLKYRFLFTLLLETGVKVSESLNLSTTDVNMETNVILISSQNRDRAIECTADLMNLYRLFIHESSIEPGLIFKGGENLGKPLSYQAVNRFWRKTCKNINPSLTLQHIRDCYAQELVKKGYDINFISKILGLKNIQNAVKYLGN